MAHVSLLLLRQYHHSLPLLEGAIPLRPGLQMPHVLGLVLPALLPSLPDVSWAEALDTAPFRA